MSKQAEDKRAIEELIGRYNHALDSGRYEDWLDCWAEDAVLDGIDQYLVGKQALRGFVRDYDASLRQTMQGGLHFTTNIVSDIDGDRATSVSYVQVLGGAGRAPRIVLAGRYEDHLVRIDGQWKFASRRLELG